MCWAMPNPLTTGIAGCRHTCLLLCRHEELTLEAEHRRLYSYELLPDLRELSFRSVELVPTDSTVDMQGR